MKWCLFALFMLVHIAVYGQTTTLCSQPVVPAGWVITGRTTCRLNGINYSSLIITRYDKLPTGSSLTLCGDVPPPNWITTAMTTCANGIDSYTARKIVRFDGYANGKTLQICGPDPVPAGWVSIAVGPTCTPSNLGAYAGGTYASRTIQRIDGEASGATMQVCGTEPTPDGWITIALTGKRCSTGSGPAVYERTIQRIDGMPNGKVLTVCSSDPTPPGWVMLSLSPICTPAGVPGYYGKTIMRIDGYPTGKTLTVCSSDLTPAGWVMVGLHPICTPAQMPNYYGRTIMRIDGYPVGKIIQICGPDPTPAGWTVMGLTGICTPASVPGFYGRTIKKAFDYQSARLTAPQISQSDTANTPSSNLDLPHEAGFALLPNPASDLVAILFDSNSPDIIREAQLFDVMGRIVAKAELSQSPTVMPLALPAGVYIMRIGSYTERLIIR